MAAVFAYFSIFSPHRLNANNRISIGPYSEASKMTTVQNPQGGGGDGLRVAHGLIGEDVVGKNIFESQAHFSITIIIRTLKKSNLSTTIQIF